MTIVEFGNKHFTPLTPPIEWGEIRMLKCLAACLMLMALTMTAHANVKQEVDSLFAAGEFEQVELVMLRLGDDQGELSDEEFASIETTAGFAMIMLDREVDARKYFSDALKLNPDLTLDPVTVSPKFRVVFDEVKTTMLAESVQPPEIVYRGARPSSRLFNLLLPGAGLIREGSLRGTVYLAAQAVSLYLLIDQLDKTSDSRAFYLAQTERSAISSAYNDYNRDYKTAWKYGVLCGVVYFAAQADLALYRQPLNDEEDELSIFLLPTERGLRFQVCW